MLSSSLPSTLSAAGAAASRAYAMASSDCISSAAASADSRVRSSRIAGTIRCAQLSTGNMFVSCARTAPACFLHNRATVAAADRRIWAVSNEGMVLGELSTSANSTGRILLEMIPSCRINPHQCQRTLPRVNSQRPLSINQSR